MDIVQVVEGVTKLMFSHGEVGVSGPGKSDGDDSVEPQKAQTITGVCGVSASSRWRSITDVCGACVGNR